MCLCVRVYVFVCVYIYIYHIHVYVVNVLFLAQPSVQGDEDSEDVLICRSFSAKEPLIIGLFCGK